jgi:hypothetical protein
LIPAQSATMTDEQNADKFEMKRDFTMTEKEIKLKVKTTKEQVLKKISKVLYQKIDKELKLCIDYAVNKGVSTGLEIALDKAKED